MLSVHVLVHQTASALPMHMMSRARLIRGATPATQLPRARSAVRTGKGCPDARPGRQGLPSLPPQAASVVAIKPLSAGVADAAGEGRESQDEVGIL